MPQDGQPDVVVFMTDQLNPRTLGCAGDPVIKTPHIDSLADEGVCFDAAYSVCPVCMPARDSFISGLYPHNHGFWSNYTDRRFPAELATVFNDVRRAGYLTAHALGCARRVLLDVRPGPRPHASERAGGVSLGRAGI